MAIMTVQAIINGTTYTLAYNSDTGMYEAEITAPTKSSYNINSGRYYPVTVKAADDAGNTDVVDDTNSKLGDSCKLYVKEITKPVISITSPTEDELTTNSRPIVNWNVTDDDSGVNPETIGLAINNVEKITSGITKTPITGGYKCTYAIPDDLQDGTNTIKCNADDFDGNTAIQRSVSFVVDTVPPSLSVTSPENNLITNNKNITVAGRSSDTTSPPVKVSVKLNNDVGQDVTVGSNGEFSTTLTLADGQNTIIVTATDAAGKTSEVMRIVTIDMKAPVISEITIPELVSVGEVFKISVKVTDQ